MRRWLAGIWYRVRPFNIRTETDERATRVAFEEITADFDR